MPVDSAFSNKNSRVRWWPAIAVIMLASLAAIFIWFSDFSHRQQQVLQTGGILLITLLLLLIWLFAFSRLPRKFRLYAAGALVAALGLGLTLFRTRGVSGDVFPVIEWRFAQNQVAALPPSSPDPVDTTSTIVSEMPAPEQPTAPIPNLTNEKRAASPHALRRDYPQFLGPDRDAKVYGIKLKRDWTKHPPQRLWRQTIGAGWSSFAVAGNFAITQEQRGGQEMVVAYDLNSGRVKWSHTDSTGFSSPITGDGPRATPTIAQNRVYALGATGMLNCLELKSGKRIWSKNILQDNGAPMNEWGIAGSPLVLDSLLVVSAGGREGKSLVAYHKDTGGRIWSGGNDRVGYSSPLVATLAGMRQILIFNQNDVAAHDPVTGQIFWQQAWPGGSECVAQPIPLPNDRVFVSSGYGVGCKLIQIQRTDSAGFQAALVWETNQLKAKFTNVVHREGYIYGLDDGILVCLDLATGTRKWKAGRYGHGQMIGVDDLLLVQTESGDVVLVEANPEAHKEISRFAALEGKTWNNPALAGEYLLVRNDREAACYKLRLESAAR
jgi:outer membrane protein assembly factor BamB